MKKFKLIYWITTVLTALMMAFSAFAYLTSDEMVQAFQHLGFPSYFRIELAVAKIIGVLILVIPAVTGRIKEWAYVGFTIVFVSAFICHIAVGDGFGVASFPLVSLVILATSYFFYHKLETGKV
jgi:DoxX-like family